MKGMTYAALVGALLAGVSAYTATVFGDLPAEVPVHWNAHGVVDGHAPKAVAVAVSTALLVVMTLLGALLPRLRRLDDDSDDAVRGVMFWLVALGASVHVVMLRAALHPTWESGRTLIACLLFSFAGFGNLLGKIRRNGWLGVRTPWSLSSEHAWFLTHRIASRAFVVAGLGGGVAVLLGAPVVVGVVALLTATVVPLAASWFYARRGRG
jgi:uncharacterized membrane protein